VTRETSGDKQETTAAHSLPARRPRISLLVAYAANRVIGKDGKMPWHLPEDLKRVRRLTMGHHIVMGRKTWESISRLLPGRHHVIVSRRPGYRVPGAQVVDSLEAALAACGDDDEIFVIGGSEIYALALPVADRIYATEIARDYEGDVFFPSLENTDWLPVSVEPISDPATPGRFVIFERRCAA